MFPAPTSQAVFTLVRLKYCNCKKIINFVASSQHLCGGLGHVYIKTFYAFIFYPLNLANSKKTEKRTATRMFTLDMATTGGIPYCRYYPYLRGLTGVAYPLSMAMREPKGWDRQREADPTLFIYTC